MLTLIPGRGSGIGSQMTLPANASVSNVLKDPPSTKPPTPPTVQRFVSDMSLCSGTRVSVLSDVALKYSFPDLSSSEGDVLLRDSCRAIPGDVLVPNLFRLSFRNMGTLSRNSSSNYRAPQPIAPPSVPGDYNSVDGARNYQVSGGNGPTLQECA